MKLKCLDDIISILMIIVMGLPAVVFLVCCNSWSEVKALKDEAVKRGHATYETDGRKIEFKWRD